jgi:hypothetical protein
MENLREIMVDAIANVIMNRDAFLAAYGKKYIVDNLMNDSTASNEDMIDLILEKKNMILEFNPDFDFSLVENNNE